MRNSEEPKRSQVETRKIAKQCGERPSTGSGVPYGAGGNSTIGLSVAGVERIRRRRYAVLRQASKFHDPRTAIAKKIANALDPEREENRVARCEESGIGGKPSIRTPGALTGVATDLAVEALVYGIKTWLKRRWVEDLGDGSLRISRDAFVVDRRLARSRRTWLAAKVQDTQEGAQ